MSNGAVKFNNGDSYEGPLANGAPHGKGIYRASTGESYDGEFENGVRNG